MLIHTQTAWWMCFFFILSILFLPLFVPVLSFHSAVFFSVTPSLSSYRGIITWIKGHLSATFAKRQLACDYKTIWKPGNVYLSPFCLLFYPLFPFYPFLDTLPHQHKFLTTFKMKCPKKVHITFCVCSYLSVFFVLLSLTQQEHPSVLCWMDQFKIWNIFPFMQMCLCVSGQCALVCCFREALTLLDAFQSEVLCMCVW